MPSTSPLVWILAIAAALIVAYLVWRWLARPRGSALRPVEPEAPTTLPDTRKADAPMPPRRPDPDIAPPPAMAGPFAQGVSRPPAGPGAAQRSAGAAPGARGNAPAPGVAPPPAAAGGQPGARPPQASGTPRTSLVPPPPAAAGGSHTTPPPGPPAAPPRPAHREARPAPPPEAAEALAAAKSWGYQLQKLDIAKAAASPFDVLVIDYAKDGGDDTALTGRDLDRLRRRPDGGERLLLAYLSIGEAESYRSYWNAAWAKAPPAWLLSENPDWTENYAVCFWDPAWQRVLCGGADAYLDKIIKAGFDGVYLDKCDVFQDIERREKAIAKQRPDLEGDMVNLVVHLSRYAKSKRPGFAIVMQNAEELLEHDDLRAAIDGVAKEELVFGQSGGERRNAKRDTADARRALDLAKSAGKPVFVVEYLEDEEKIREAATYAAAAGYVLYVSTKDRELDRLNYVVLET